ncbi:MAG: dipicolinate synthase subunit B [Clostridia bacterium]|nr:dipicolinate synthase subunit B [Clostridia bacterium]
MKLCFAFTGSFCNHARAYEVLREAVEGGSDVYPVFSYNAKNMSTRFGDAGAFEERVRSICGRDVICDITGAEQTVTGGSFDCVAVCPCTGNTCAKIACGITDTPVTMAVKAQLRNGGSVLLALASNDSLSGNLKNVGVCMDKKHVFFVPVRQDDPVKKPNSLVCDFSKVLSAAEYAARGEQMQPIFI